MPERFGEDAGSWRADGVAGCTHPHGNATEGLGSPRARREESAADRSGLRSIGTGPHRMPETMRERATSYRDDVELEYPQSGERFRGRRNVVESRGPGPDRQYHGVSRRKGRARDAVLCRPVRGAGVARTLARNDALTRRGGNEVHDRARALR